MADSRGFKPINQLWSATVAGDPDSQCLYEEISSSREGPPGSELRPPGFTKIVQNNEITHEVRPRSRNGKLRHAQQQQQEQTAEESRLGEDGYEKWISTRVAEHRDEARGYYGETGVQRDAAETSKLTRGRSAAARYPHPATAAAFAAQYHLYQQSQTFPQQHYHEFTGLRRPGARPRQRQIPRGPFSDETQEKIQEDDEATLRELLVRYVRPGIHPCRR